MVGVPLRDAVDTARGSFGGRALREMKVLPDGRVLNGRGTRRGNRLESLIDEARSIMERVQRSRWFLQLAL